MVLTLSASAAENDGNRLVILHTNDTHSHIDAPADGKLGGILRRKVLIDSVRAAEKNVLLIDAGDAVQGSLYYSLFGGEVERKLMNALGYDMQILGNHEFDSGLDVLAREWSQLNATRLASNYDVRGTVLEELMSPYRVFEVDGKKIGFLAINIDPEGMISADNCRGVKYLDGMKAANSMAWYLRNVEHCDLVVALTHIGYKTAPGYVDLNIAEGSEDIDIIIGGHSHTLINPDEAKGQAWRVANAAGDSVLVAQAGAYGEWLGEVDIDLSTGKATSKVIPVGPWLDSRIAPEAAALLNPYRHQVDSILGLKIGEAVTPLTKPDWSLVNFVTDFVEYEGCKLSGKKTELALMNKGGIRCDMPQGDITQGLLMQMLPFDNRIVVIELSGRDLLDAFDVMASRYGDGVSSGVKAVFDPESKKCVDVKIDGKSIDPDRIYTVSTIDYLANGGDFMKSLKNGREIARSKSVLYDDFINYFKNGPMKGKKTKAQPGARMIAKEVNQ